MIIDLSNIREFAKGTAYFFGRQRYRLHRIRIDGFTWNKCSCCNRLYQRSGGELRCGPCDAAVAIACKKAHAIVNGAVKHGRLTHASMHACVDCGKLASCYDHRDYARPLDVDPVCKSCDRKRGAGEPFRTQLKVLYPRANAA